MLIHFFHDNIRQSLTHSTILILRSAISFRFQHKTFISIAVFVVRLISESRVGSGLGLLLLLVFYLIYVSLVSHHFRRIFIVGYFLYLNWVYEGKFPEKAYQIHDKHHNAYNYQYGDYAAWVGRLWENYKKNKKTYYNNSDYDHEEEPQFMLL